MDSMKRNRTEVAATKANAGFKKSKSETDSLSSGIGSKTKPCNKFFSKAGCPFGENCHFTHYFPGGYEAVSHLLKLEPLPASSRNVTTAGGATNVTPNGSGSNVLKSKLCSKYNTAEGCKYGESCHFAHGESELNKPLPNVQPRGGGSPPRVLGGVPRFGGGGGGGGGGSKLGSGLFNWMESTVVSRPAASSFGASATAKISVAASLAGPIIGKSGVNSKHICMKTGVKLGVREHDSDPNLRNIELEGTLDQIQEASVMVKELIASLGSAGSGGGSGGGPAKSNGERGLTMPPVANRYKTKLCENFAKGSCTFGEQCHFAHGSSQLRQKAGV